MIQARFGLRLGELAERLSEVGGTCCQPFVGSKHPTHRKSKGIMESISLLSSRGQLGLAVANSGERHGIATERFRPLLRLNTRHANLLPFVRRPGRHECRGIASNQATAGN